MALASQALKYNYVIIQPIGGNAIDLTGHLQYIEYFEDIMSPTTVSYTHLTLPTTPYV